MPLILDTLLETMPEHLHKLAPLLATLDRAYAPGDILYVARLLGPQSYVSSYVICNAEISIDDGGMWMQVCPEETPQLKQRLCLDDIGMNGPVPYNLHRTFLESGAAESYVHYARESNLDGRSLVSERLINPDLAERIVGIS